jgi:hypothetical protein
MSDNALIAGDCSLARLDMLAARWREEAEKARETCRLANKLGNKKWGMCMTMRAMVYEGCAAELDGAGSGHIDPKLSDCGGTARLLRGGVCGEQQP